MTSLTSPSSTFSAYRTFRNGVEIGISSPNGSWWLSFAAPQNAQLTVGTYLDARRASLERPAGLLVTRSTYCERVTGRFVVHEIVINGSGQVTRFAADFEQHCNDNDAALFGAVRFNSLIASTTPFGGSYPAYELQLTPPAGGQITGPGLACGAGGSACDASFGSPTGVTLTATPDAGQVFMGWIGSCSGDELVTLNINGPRSCGALFASDAAGIARTRLELDSQTGDPLANGVKRIFSAGNSGWSFSLDGDRSGLELSVAGDDGENWRMRFDAPDGTVLGPGAYDGARRPFDQTWGPKLETRVLSPLNSCSTISGRFVIYEISYTLDGAVQTLSVDFEQFCNGSSHGLYGAVRYNSSMEEVRPFAGLYPSHALTITPDTGGRVTGPGLDCGGSGSACVVTPGPGTSIALTATSEAGYVFAGWRGHCTGGASTIVVVTGSKHCAPVFEPETSGTPRSFLWLHSETGDALGGGARLAYSSETSRWSVVGADATVVHLRVDTADGPWTLQFGAPSGTALAPGTYLNALGSSHPLTVPTMYLRRAGGSCGGERGRFIVHDIAFSGSTLTRLAIDFESHCGDAAAAMFGAVRYNTDVAQLRPFGGVFPTYALTIANSPNGRVTGTSISCGAGHSTCAATYAGATMVSLTATPEAGYAFVGWHGGCSGLETTTIHVNGPKSCSASFVSVTGGTPRSLLLIDGQPGSSPGGGNRYLFSQPTTTFTGSFVYTGVVQIQTETPGGERWSVWFSAPPGTTLQPGVYEGARRSPFNGMAPGLSLTGQSTGCNELSGRFVVHEIALGSGNTIQRFAADFEHHCEDQDAAVFGIVRYNSSVGGVRAFGGAYPVYSLQITAPQNGRVTGAAIACGGGQTTCSTTYQAPTSVALTAVPHAGYMFAGWGADCRGNEATTIRVHTVRRCTVAFLPLVPTAQRTQVLLDSEPGDYIGGGRRWSYSSANAIVAASVTDAGNGVSFNLDGADGSYWRFSFRAPQLQALSLGAYPNAVRAPFRTNTPGLEVSGNSNGCNQLTGRFIVRELQISCNSVVRAAIDFEQRCDNNVNRLVGSLRYQATSPLAMIGQRTTPILTGQAARTSNGGWMPRNRARDDDYAVNSTLQLPWPTYNATSGEVHPAFGDVDGDGLNEVVLGLGRGGQGYIAILDDEAHGYALLRWIQVGWAPYNTANGAVFPAVGDLDGDGYAEIVAGLGQGGQGYLQVFGGSNRGYAHQRWLQTDYPSWNALNGETHPAVGDLNNDGQAEIVVGLGNGGGGWVLVLNDASLLYSKQQWIRLPWAAFWTRSGATWPAIGDIDGNGSNELLLGLGTGGEGYLHVWSTGGALAPREWLRVSWPDYNVLRCGETRPAIGRLGTAGPGVVVGLGTCSGIAGGWLAILETSHPGRPTLWRNDTDGAFRNSGAGVFPAVIPR